MRKILFFSVLLVLLVCICSCAQEEGSGNSMTYVSFDKLADDYGVDDAVRDGCVVFVDSAVISGDDNWENFITEVDEGKICNIRIANSYADDTFFLTDISFNGSSFNVVTNNGVSREYYYLNHCEIDVDDKSSNGSKINCYILTNDQNVKWEDVEQSFASSFFQDAMDNYIVYYELI